MYNKILDYIYKMKKQIIIIISFIILFILIVLLIKRHKRTFGKGIEFVLIDQVKSSEWKFWEKYYISLFKTWGFKLENLNNGGGGPEVYLKETKLKMSLNRIGKYNGNENPFFGKTHSDETRKIISEAQKGKIWIVNSNNERTRIIPEQFEEYSKLGYKRGRKYR